RAEVDGFFALAEQNAEVRPWLVVVLMHEYYRNLYPCDPHLPWPAGRSHLKRIAGVVETATRLLSGSAALGSYLGPGAPPPVPAGRGAREAEGPTQQVYGRLWDAFDAGSYVEEVDRILAERFDRSGFELATVRGKTVLDMGCGSGRFTLALARAGADRVIGVDLGRQSLDEADRIATGAGIDNVQFIAADVLDLPFDDEAFDFVFCNGVLHHTADMERGVRQLYRVLRRGAEAFLYLYGDGGLFWYSRKRMGPIMKRIPQAYTMAALDLIGMPPGRFIFADNWYVPIERHTTRADLERLLTDTGFASFRKLTGGRATDLDSAEAMRHPEAAALWGDGEHRYLLVR
ncbi:MAG: class I SAM-dependent methyltransferase, partial [Planctomycetota bacterium]